MADTIRNDIDLVNECATSKLLMKSHIELLHFAGKDIKEQWFHHQKHKKCSKRPCMLYHVPIRGLPPFEIPFSVTHLA